MRAYILREYSTIDPWSSERTTLWSISETIVYEGCWVCGWKDSAYLLERDVWLGCVDEWWDEDYGIDDDDDEDDDEPDLEREFEQFLLILIQATEAVEEHYFRLRLAGQDDPIFRERVYCYELYRCIRELMPVEWGYVLTGEVDKAGHPLLRDQCGPKKPGFIVHTPGTMTHNLAVIEVKPANADEAAILEDLETLKCFVESAGYTGGILLLYGDLGPRVERLRRVASEYLRHPQLELVWHQLPGQRAEILPPLPA